MSPLNIAIVQSDLAWHDPARNRDNFAARIAELDDSVDLVVLPEMFATGFTMDAPAQAESMDGPSVEWLRAMAARHDMAICGSLAIRDGDTVYNRFLLAESAGALHTYDKRHLFRLAGEDKRYAPGEDLVTIQLGAWRVRPMVCYDLRFPVWSRRTDEDDYDLLLYVANWPAPRQQAWDRLLPARAIENQCYVAAVNRVGRDGNDNDYTGGSVIIDFLGNELAALGDAPGSAVATLDANALQDFRDAYPFARDADLFMVLDAGGDA